MAKNDPAEFGRMLLACVEYDQMGHGEGQLRVPERFRLEYLADWLDEYGPHLLETASVGDDVWCLAELGPAAREVATVPLRGSLPRNQRGKTRFCDLVLTPNPDCATVTAKLVFNAIDLQGGPRVIDAKVIVRVHIRGDLYDGVAADVRVGEKFPVSFTPTQLPLAFSDPGMQGGLDLIRWHAIRMLAGWPLERLAMLHAEPTGMLSARGKATRS